MEETPDFVMLRNHSRDFGSLVHCEISIIFYDKGIYTVFNETGSRSIEILSSKTYTKICH